MIADCEAAMAAPGPSDTGAIRLRRPNPETFQRIGAKRMADRNVLRVATATDKHPANARNIIAGIKDMPCSAEIDLEPG